MENISILQHHNDSTLQPEPESPTTTRQLPPDLVSEILTRLPVKPLARFKTVSKPWLSLLTSRHFILRHITHSLSTSSNTNNLHITRLGRSTLASLHFPTPDNSPSTPVFSNTIHLPFSTRSPDSDFIGSCHGLLLISDHPNFISLFNPTTRTHFTLPVRLPKQKSESHWVDFGLGYDIASDVYKIIRIDQFNGPGTATKPREVRVFTMLDNPARFRWRKVEVNFPHYLAHPKGHGYYLNNSIHWMATKNPPNVYDVGSCMKIRNSQDKTFYKYVIVAFNLSNETFSEIELPFSNAWMKKQVFPKPKLVLLGQKLGVQIEYGEFDKRCVELWLMSECSSWVKVYAFLYKQVRGNGSDGSGFGRLTPLMIVENGGDNVEVLMEENEPIKVSYLWYNVKSGGMKEVEVCGEIPPLFEWRGGHRCYYGGVVYVDSLVALSNAGLVHAQPPENPAEDITDINSSGVLPINSFRVHSQDMLVHRPDLGRCFVPVVGLGKRLP